jgi:hypothetical protein
MLLKIVQPDFAQPGLCEHRLGLAVVKIVGIKDRSVGRRERQLIGDVVLTFQECLQQPSVAKFNRTRLNSRERSTRRLFLLLVVVCSRRT